jgi:hypothetical protein
VSIFYQPKGHWRESLRSLRRYEYVLPPRIHRYGRPLTHGQLWYYLNQRRPLAQRPLWGNVCVLCGSITVGPETGDRDRAQMHYAIGGNADRAQHTHCGLAPGTCQL